MKQWYADIQCNRIVLLERGRCKQQNSWGAFFDSWSEAHKHLIEAAEEKLVLARRQLQYAQDRAGNVRGMKPPKEVMKESA